MKNKLLILALLLNCSYCFCQMNGYEYKREILGIKGQWNSIELPDDLYGKVSRNLSDIRVYGITSKNDTLETPYIFVKHESTVNNPNSDFNLINQSKKGSIYYFTFQTKEDRTINQLQLNFNQKNYDWRIKLEGSQDQQNWFTVVDHYRIMSIKNDLTDYQFGKIVFPDSKYNYYRIGIPANEKPLLKSAKMILMESSHSLLTHYALKRILITQDKRRKQTIIDLELKTSVPVNKLKIGVNDNMDYYRPMEIEYLTDSFKTDKSWYFNYGEAAGAMILSSVDQRNFELNRCITNKLRLTIDNHDNRPLKFSTFIVEGYKNILITRMSGSASYYLCYGKKNSLKPEYDIEQFSYKISTMANKTTLGNEEFVDKSKPVSSGPLFTNKAWLWGIMILIIGLLGWFTLKMMKKKE